MFAKLNIQFEPDIWKQLNKQVDFGRVVNGRFMGIEYFNIHYAKAQQLYELLPLKFHKDFYLSLLKITDLIPPHTDSHDRAVINFYIKPSECETSFYRLANENPSMTQIKNMTDGHLFDLSDLQKVGGFTAHVNEIYLLNTKVIHGVSPKNADVDRQAIQLGTGEYSYDEVKEMLIQKGLINVA